MLVAIVSALSGLRPASASAGGAPFAAEIQIDGVPTRVDERYESEAIAITVERYVARWQAERPGEPVVRTSSSEWRVLGQRVGTRYRTAQFATAPGGGTRVLLASRPLHQTTAVIRSAIPLPVATQALRTVATRAGDRVATQTFAVSTQPAPALFAALTSVVTRSGWTPTVAADPVPAIGAAARVGAWRRGDEELLAVVGDGRPSTLLIHHVQPARARELR